VTPSVKHDRIEHPFAQYVRILGKGKTGTRSLSRAEARDAFSMIMRGQVEPLQLGAFLMLLRVKEETGEELAGFVEACRETMLAPPQDLGADLDWSSYAGKRHQHPWYILAILLLSEAGFRVFIHGSDGHTAGRLYTEQAFIALGLPVADNWLEVGRQLDSERLSYLSLHHFCQPLNEILQLRSLLGLRSPVNTLARLLNPLRAPCALQSIFHPAYAQLHHDAGCLLGQSRALVFKGDSGEIEIKPQADTRLVYLTDQEKQELSLKRSIAQRVTSVDQPSVEAIRQLWRAESVDDYGLDATLATTAVALALLTPGITLPAAREKAGQLWQDRDKARLR